MRLSIVIPIFNGSETIRDLVEVVKKELSEIDHEIILVNDGSKDNSEDLCEELAIRNNFGEHNAVMCGLHVSTGDYIVIIDDDFQNPPSEIKKLFKEAVVGNYDVVYSRYHKKYHHWFRNIGSRLANLVASFILDKPLSLYLSSFKVIKREVVNEVIKYKGANLFLDGLLLRITNNIGVYEVAHSPRKTGKSNYNFTRLFSLFMNMLINHSIRPLRVVMFLGLAAFIIGAGSFFYFLDLSLMDQSPALNWKLFLSGSMALAGSNAIILGLIGEYLGKHLVNSSSMPQFVIKKAVLHHAVPPVDFSKNQKI
jgi:polyisoprenyl-phosphate glycosyltransferase